MALTDENNMVMPVAPMYGNGNNGFGFGGDGAWWLILLLLCGGMWGGFGGLGGFGMMNGMWGGMELYPWMNQAEITAQGFQNQAIGNQLSGIQSAVTSGFGDVQLGIAGINQNICQTGNGITAAVNGAQNAITQQMYANEIASLNRSFAGQTANTQGFNGVNTGLADLKYTVATENCADRTAAAQNTRDIIDNQNRVGQSIIDKLCQLELDGVKGQYAASQRENFALQNQVNMANFAASLTAQSGQIVDDIYNRLATCPVGSMPVYGNQPIFTCGGNTCGCGAVA